MSIEEELRKYIVENVPGTDSIAFSDEDSLAEKGVIDSQGFIQLISFVEERFAIKFLDGDITADNCGNLLKFARFVRSRIK